MMSCTFLLLFVFSTNYFYSINDFNNNYINYQNYYQIINKAESLLIKEDFNNALTLYKKLYRKYRFFNKDLYNAYLCSEIMKNQKYKCLFLREIKCRKLICKVDTNECCNQGVVDYYMADTICLNKYKDLADRDQNIREIENGKYYLKDTVNIVDKLIIKDLMTLIERNQIPNDITNGNVHLRPYLPAEIVFWHYYQKGYTELNTLLERSIDIGNVHPLILERLEGVSSSRNGTFNYEVIVYSYKSKLYVSKKVVDEEEKINLYRKRKYLDELEDRLKKIIVSNSSHKKFYYGYTDIFEFFELPQLDRKQRVEQFIGQKCYEIDKDKFIKNGLNSLRRTRKNN